jgi:hypothetical protein
MPSRGRASADQGFNRCRNGTMTLADCKQELSLSSNIFGFGQIGSLRLRLLRARAAWT